MRIRTYLLPGRGADRGSSQTVESLSGVDVQLVATQFGGMVSAIFLPWRNSASGISGVTIRFDFSVGGRRYAVSLDEAKKPPSKEVAKLATLAVREALR